MPPPAPAGTTGSAEHYPIVGIGASAGGFEAFRDLLKALPADTGMAFVLVQHLDPLHESMLAKLLAGFTAMPVTDVADGTAVEPDHVYVMPPNTQMGIEDGKLHLSARGDAGAKHLPINHFLRSLAEERRDLAIGVILSGTGSDGTLGLKSIKAAGGTTLVQDGQSAKYDGMPRSAIASGKVDFVLTPDGIARELARIGRDKPAVENHAEIRRIFTIVQKATGVNFTSYRYSTIRRRIARRMLLHKLESLAEYVSFMQKNPTEAESLCEDILIHVTGFFREPEAFQALAEWILPRILEGKGPGEPVRIWVTGCSTGEETYSIAMVLLEVLGDRAEETPVQIFGTDISEGAIEKARAGIYGESSLASVSPERQRRFFFKVDGGYQVIKAMRDLCVFARHDLVKDPPFSRIDLISCHNVLIYMLPPLQNKVLKILSHALQPTGFLMLGKSESVTRLAGMFPAVDRRHKIFSKGSAEPGFQPSSRAGYESPAGATATNQEPHIRLDPKTEADRIVLSQYAPAGLVVDENLHILQFRGQCSPYLAPSPGEASLGLLRMVRPEFAVDLRKAVQRATKEWITVRQEGIRVQREGLIQDVSVDVIPIQGERGARHALILFQNTPLREAAGTHTGGDGQAGGEGQDSEIVRLRVDAEKMREYLQAVIHDHEASNVELRSANEEALSSNEELQFTNEELETAKEELQSANEELVTLNEQLEKRNVELGQLNDDLNNVLDSAAIPILILSGDRRIRRFTAQAEKLLNLRPGDVGRPIDDLQTNIDVEDLAGLVDEVVETVSVREREVQDREGRWYSMRVGPYRTLDGKTDGAVLVFIDIDAARRMHLELQREQAFTAAVLESAGALVVVTDVEGRVVRFNLACQRLSGYSFEEVEGKPIWAVLAPPGEVAVTQQIYRELAETRSARQHEGHWVDRKGREHLISWYNTAVSYARGSAHYIVRVGVDITAARLAETALRQNEQMLRQSQENLRALTAGLLDAREEERSRVARDLHDDLGQRLAALSIQVELIRQSRETSKEKLQAKLHDLQKQIALMSEDLRGIARDLHPFTLTHLGLEGALRPYCQEFSQQRQIKMRFTAKGLPVKLPPAVALCVYRVVQEALGNIASHAAAKRAAVSISCKANALHASILDNGSGFDLERLRGKGLGLISMEERVRHAGGTFSIKTAPGQGTRLNIRIPLTASRPARRGEGGTR